MSTMTWQPEHAFRVAPVRTGEVRLTRRGRVVVFVLALAFVLAAGVLIAGGSVATQEPAPTRVVQIAPGETLWDIASRLTPAGDDVRSTMYDIKALNALESSALEAGQRIKVPAE